LVLKEEHLLIVHSPKDMAAGRHMMVWVWYYNDAPQWSTCFDVQVSGTAKNPISAAPAAAYSAPVAAANAVAPSSMAAAPAAPSPAAAAPAPVAPVNVAAVAPANDAPAPSMPPSPTKAAEVEGATTVTEWFTEWTTDYVAETAAPFGAGYKAKRHPQAKRHAREFSS
jgi:hypothetical protein